MYIHDHPIPSVVSGKNLYRLEMTGEEALEFFNYHSLKMRIDNPQEVKDRIDTISLVVVKDRNNVLTRDADCIAKWSEMPLSVIVEKPEKFRDTNSAPPTGLAPWGGNIYVVYCEERDNHQKTKLNIIEGRSDD